MTALKPEAWKPDDLIKAVALAGAAVAFFIGLIQYRVNQRWKRAEWVAQEMKTLFADQLLQAALFMIDWDNGELTKLFPGRGYEKCGKEILENHEINHALRYGSRAAGFSPLEAEIRSAFDHLFDGIDRFHSYFATGLVTASDLRPYLAYWARGICNPRTPENRGYHLQTYMNAYGFDGALRLLKHLARPRLGQRIANLLRRQRKN